MMIALSICHVVAEELLSDRSEVCKGSTVSSDQSRLASCCSLQIKEALSLTHADLSPICR